MAGSAPADRPVIIVGAGPVGLCASLNLANRGIESLVLEGQTELSSDLRASTFHPPTLDMLESLGLTDEILAHGLRVPTWQVRMHATHERAVFNLGVLTEDTDHPYRVQFEQAAFCRLALRKAQASELIEIQFGATVAQVEAHGDRVRVRWNRDRENCEAMARFVIAADGANSTVRGVLGLAFHGLTYPETTILATTTFPFEAHLPGLSWVNYVWADDTTFSLLRVPDRWRCSLYPRPGESVEELLRPERVQSRLQEIVPNPAGYDIIEIRPYRIHQRIIDTYRVGRILFAGDAAHVNSPSGGMGMNCGIHDAFNLTDKLAGVINENGEPGRLDLYDRQRRPIARDEILKQADSNRERMQQRDPEWRRQELERLQGIAADPEKAHEFLLRSSMIAGLRRAAAVQ